MTDPLLSFLREAATWSSFAASLVASADRYGSLTPRQEAAAQGMMAKCAQARAERNLPRAPLDLSPIHAMFDRAKAAGLNKLGYRAEGLVISPASASGRNAGALYVKTEDTKAYQGKVADNAWHPVRECEPFVLDALRVISRNPAEAATAYGKRTGSCACCGRELTNPESIERGIGPICAEKWFGA